VDRADDNKAAEVSPWRLDVAQAGTTIVRQKDDQGTMKIYLAGPLFSTAEIAFNKELANLLRTRGHDVFLPQEHEQRKDLPKAIFESDLKGLDWADAVVACLDGPDPDSGTCWELGYAYARKKLSIVYRTDFRLFERSDPINLMMTDSADHVIIMPTAPIADLAAEIGRLLDEESDEIRK
jgi:nucleoside 2-deoxyribosyltransferase